MASNINDHRHCASQLIGTKQASHNELSPSLMLLRSDERGSLFVYILLAVALFASLTYAVSNDRGGNADVFTEEQAKLAAQEIIEYGNNLANAVQKLRLRGCSDTQISFENGVVAGYSNPSAPTDKSCHVFDANGGNVNWTSISTQQLEKDHSTYNAYGEIYFPNTVQVADIGTSCSTGDCTELLFQVPHLKPEICDRINVILGNTESGASLSEAVINLIYQDAYKFIGTYDFQTASQTSMIGDNSFPSGKVNGCIYRGGAGSIGSPYTYYHVLLAR